MDLIDKIEKEIKQTNRTFSITYRPYFHEYGTTLMQEESEKPNGFISTEIFLCDQDKQICFETDHYWSVCSTNRKGRMTTATGSCLKTLLEWLIKEVSSDN